MMKLIDEWKHLWKALSVQANFLGASALIGYKELPDDMRSQIPHSWVIYGAAAIFLLGIVGRAIKQESMIPQTDSGPTDGEPK